jgi:hypothetical protein
MPLSEPLFVGLLGHRVNMKRATTVPAHPTAAKFNTQLELEIQDETAPLESARLSVPVAAKGVSIQDAFWSRDCWRLSSQQTVNRSASFMNC